MLVYVVIYYEYNILSNLYECHKLVLTNHDKEELYREVGFLILNSSNEIRNVKYFERRV